MNNFITGLIEFIESNITRKPLRSGPDYQIKLLEDPVMEIRIHQGE